MMQFKLLCIWNTQTRSLLNRGNSCNYLRENYYHLQLLYGITRKQDNHYKFKVTLTPKLTNYHNKIITHNLSNLYQLMFYLANSSSHFERDPKIQVIIQNKWIKTLLPFTIIHFFLAEMVSNRIQYQTKYPLKQNKIPMISYEFQPTHFDKIERFRHGCWI